MSMPAKIAHRPEPRSAISWIVGDDSRDGKGEMLPKPSLRQLVGASELAAGRSHPVGPVNLVARSGLPAVCRSVTSRLLRTHSSGTPLGGRQSTPVSRQNSRTRKRSFLLLCPLPGRSDATFDGRSLLSCFINNNILESSCRYRREPPRLGRGSPASLESFYP
jgi:hypothetical protein